MRVNVFVQWFVGRAWIAQLLLFMGMRCTARHAMARSMVQKAMALARERGSSIWTRGSLWGSNMKGE